MQLERFVVELQTVITEAEKAGEPIEPSVLRQLLETWELEDEGEEG